MSDSIKYTLGEVRLYTERDVQDEVYKNLYKNAPKIVHQRLCEELANISRSNAGKEMKDVKEFMDMIGFIEIFEELYPELKAR